MGFRILGLGFQGGLKVKAWDWDPYFPCFPNEL